MRTPRYLIADCDGFDDLGNAYVLFTNDDDYAKHPVDVEPCFFGPALPPVQPEVNADPDFNF